MSDPLTVPLSIDWSGGVSNAWSSVANFIPKLAIFLIVLIIGWIIAKVVAKVVGVVLTKIGFEQMLAKGGVGEKLSGAGVKPVGLISKLVYYFILLIALQLALTAFGQHNPVSDILNKILAWLPQAFVAVIIVVVTVFIANAVKDILGSALGGVSYGRLLTNIVGVFIIGLGVIAAVNQIGVAVTVTEPVLIAVLATLAGILIVGVGGGLIAPMRSRWEQWLTSMQAEADRTRDASAAGPDPSQD